MRIETKAPFYTVPFFIVQPREEPVLLQNNPSNNFLTSSTDTDILNDSDEFPEGKEKTRLHKSNERNAKAVKAKKQQVLLTTGKLLCEVCDFDFNKFYGEYGYGFAECHHTIPVHNLTEGHKTRLSDLSIVCSNCHRILHRSRPIMFSIQELREIVKKQLGRVSI
jgi:predicted HNH restriction endonuclease